MPRDYAKKKAAPKKKRGASRGKKQAAVPLSLWFFTVATVIALAAGLAYLKWSKPSTSAKLKPATTQNSPVDPQSNQSNAEDKNVDDVPFYDVHHDLTNKKVEIPKDDLKLPDDYKKYYYTMPCGAFRDPGRADELKAMIALTGNTSDVSSVQSHGETWYRVQLGPFNSKRTAERIRHRLQENGIQDCNINRHTKAE